MTRITQICCPKCGARTSIDYEKNRCFCTYCGTELIVEEGTNTITYNATYRKIDEARITESRNQKEIIFKQFEEQHKNEKLRLVVSAIVVVAWLISLLVLICICVDKSFGIYHILSFFDIVFGLPMITQFFKGSKDNKPEN